MLAARTRRTDDQDALCQIGYPDASGSDCNVTHDYFGNVIAMPTQSGQQRSLGYYLSGKVRNIDDPDNHATFRYDAFGALQELNITGTTNDTRSDRHYGNLTVRSSGSTSYISRSFPGIAGMTVSLRGANGDFVYTMGDGRGVRFTTNFGGEFLQDVSYQPFGVATSTGESPPSPLYTTEQWNDGDALAAFGLSILGDRVYDPVIGRFLQRDPLHIARTGATSNPYAFAANDPKPDR